MIFFMTDAEDNGLRRMHDGCCEAEGPSLIDSHVLKKCAPCYPSLNSILSYAFNLWPTEAKLTLEPDLESPDERITFIFLVPGRWSIPW